MPEEIILATTGEKNSFQAAKLFEQITKKHKQVSGIKTPPREVKKRPDGRGGYQDYTEARYMKKLADENYPGWSWEILKAFPLGSEAFVIHGRLMWFETTKNGVLKRSGDMVAAHRVQRSKSSDKFVDVGNDVKAANTDCFKKALSFFMNIADDIYRYEDLDLSKDEIKELLELAEKAGDYDRIKQLIDENKIYRTNYKASKEKLEELAKYNEK